MSSSACWAASAPKGGSPRPDARVLEPYIPFVDETLSRYPRLVATRIQDMLVERGYEGSVRTLRRYVPRARPARATRCSCASKRPASRRRSTGGASARCPLPGGHRALWAFVMVLALAPCGRSSSSTSASTPCVARLVRAVAFFGSCTRQWLFDNAKTIVIEQRARGRRRSLSPPLPRSRLASSRAARALQDRESLKKGEGVERAIRYLKERFFAARSFHSLQHGNAQLVEFFATIAHPRPHPRWTGATRGRRSSTRNARACSPWPDPLPSTDSVGPIAVDKTAFVKLDTNRYSVPALYARRTLALVADDRLVRLVDGAEGRAPRHSWGTPSDARGARAPRRALGRKSKARDLKGRDRLRVEVPEIVALLEHWVEAGRNIGSMIGFTIKLLDAYGAAVHTCAVSSPTCSCAECTTAARWRSFASRRESGKPGPHRR